jgi:hypothetical protein
MNTLETALNGLTSLSDATAESLGKHNNELFLNDTMRKRVNGK